MNTMGEEILRYNFTNAMVSKISLSEGGATDQRRPDRGGDPRLRDAVKG